MSNVIVVKNGLFKKDDYLDLELKEIVHSLRSQDIEVIESTEIRRTRNEQIWADLRSEQEILQYLDRISEEDEHNNNV